LPVSAITGEEAGSNAVTQEFFREEDVCTEKSVEYCAKRLLQAINSHAITIQVCLFGRENSLRAMSVHLMERNQYTTGFTRDLGYGGVTGRSVSK
jgi:hypothetical protein